MPHPASGPKTLPLLIALFLLSAVQARSQTQTFDLAAIHQNKSAEPLSSNIPLGPGDVYSPTAGILRATNVPLLTYIAFAYRMTDGQLAAFTRQAPEWVTSDHFNIEAHTDIPAVTKDQLRLMMRTLLADRFHLAVHYETRQANTFELTLVTPNKTGPSLRPHPPAEPCSKTFSNNKDDPPQPETIALGFPTVCGGILGLPASAADRYKIGARNVPLALIANSFASWGNLGRPVIDRTSLQGNYDFVLEFTPDPPPTGAPDSGGPSFQQALKQQLGLKLEPRKSPVDILLLDHIDHLTDN